MVVMKCNHCNETITSDFYYVEEEIGGYVEVFEAPEISPYPGEQVYGYGYSIALLENESYGVLIESAKYDEYSESLYWLEDEFETKEEAEIFAKNYVIGKYEGLHKRTLDALKQQAKDSVKDK